MRLGQVGVGRDVGDQVRRARRSRRARCRRGSDPTRRRGGRADRARAGRHSRSWSPPRTRCCKPPRRRARRGWWRRATAGRRMNIEGAERVGAPHQGHHSPSPSRVRAHAPDPESLRPAEQGRRKAGKVPLPRSAELRGTRPGRSPPHRGEQTPPVVYRAGTVPAPRRTSPSAWCRAGFCSRTPGGVERPRKRPARRGTDRWPAPCDAEQAPDPLAPFFEVSNTIAPPADGPARSFHSTSTTPTPPMGKKPPAGRLLPPRRRFSTRAEPGPGGLIDRISLRLARPLGHALDGPVRPVGHGAVDPRTRKPGRGRRRGSRHSGRARSPSRGCATHPPSTDYPRSDEARARGRRNARLRIPDGADRAWAGRDRCGRRVRPGSSDGYGRRPLHHPDVAEQVSDEASLMPASSDMRARMRRCTGASWSRPGRYMLSMRRM